MHQGISVTLVQEYHVTQNYQYLDCWHHPHSIRSRVYATVGRPSVRLSSVCPVRPSHAAAKVCWCGLVGQEISIDHGGCRAFELGSICSQRAVTDIHVAGVSGLLCSPSDGQELLRGNRRDYVPLICSFWLQFKLTGFTHYILITDTAQR